ncbi:outer membrane protein assembly factor BamB family protein [Streptomyces sp. NBC_00344]|uniref:outer membrane protein assembly factor BamB family protein n=1 Tax=Streptomyces sp. NBC_00344 TaxID=2975720 RepID=UPI002E200F4F
MNDKMDGWTWKSADAEEAEAPPPTNRQWVVPRRSPAESARAAAAWFRAEWIKLTTVLVVIALAIGGWQTYTYLTRYHEQTSGPHGDFPAALGSGAPLRPDRVQARLGSPPVGIVGGLLLKERNDGITADNVRTGKEYWHYGREDTALITEWVSNDTAFLWYEDGLAVAVNLHSGKPRWHAEVPGSTRDSGNRVWVSGDTLFVSRTDQLTALSTRGGKRLWSVAPPKGCKAWDQRTLVGLDGVEAIDANDCSRDSEHAEVLFGVDPATGSTRWHVDEEAIGYRRLGAHTLATLTLGGALITTDVSGAEPRTRETPLSHDVTPRGAGRSDGLLLLGSDENRSLTGRQVSADSSSKALWTRKASKGLEFGIPRTTDGRVYVAQYRTPMAIRRNGGSGTAHLLVLDARTGHELHRTALPASLYDHVDDLALDQMSIVEAKYGIVTVGWIGDLVNSAAQAVLAE